MNRSTKSSFVAAAAALSSLLMLACGADEAPAAKAPNVVGMLYAADFYWNFVNVLPVTEDGSLLSDQGRWPLTRALVWGPVKILVHPSGFLLVLTNLNSVSSIPIDKATGNLDIDNMVQTATGHPPNNMILSESGDRLYIANNDSTISVFDVGADGTLTETENSPFATKKVPFGLATDGARLFVSHGEQTLGEVYVFTIGDNGDLSESEGSPFPIGAGASPLLVAGSFLLVPNVADDNLSVFAISGDALTEAPGSPYATGDSPRGLALNDRNQVYVANRRNRSVSAFSVDADKGTLAPIPGQPFAAEDNPITIILAPSGRLAFAPTEGGYDRLTVFRVEETGALTKTYAPGFQTGSQLAYFELSPQ